MLLKLSKYPSNVLIDVVGVIVFGLLIVYELLFCAVIFTGRVNPVPSKKSPTLRVFVLINVFVS